MDEMTTIYIPMDKSQRDLLFDVLRDTDFRDYFEIDGAIDFFGRLINQLKEN